MRRFRASTRNDHTSTRGDGASMRRDRN